MMVDVPGGKATAVRDAGTLSVWLADRLAAGCNLAIGPGDAILVESRKAWTENENKREHDRCDRARNVSPTGQDIRHCPSINAQVSCTQRAKCRIGGLGAE